MVRRKNKHGTLFTLNTVPTTSTDNNTSFLSCSPQTLSITSTSFLLSEHFSSSGISKYFPGSVLASSPLIFFLFCELYKEFMLEGSEWMWSWYAFVRQTSLRAIANTNQTRPVSVSLLPNWYIYSNDSITSCFSLPLPHNWHWSRSTF